MDAPLWEKRASRRDHSTRCCDELTVDAPAVPAAVGQPGSSTRSTLRCSPPRVGGSVHVLRRKGTWGEGKPTPRTREKRWRTDDSRAEVRRRMESCQFTYSAAGCKIRAWEGAVRVSGRRRTQRGWGADGGERCESGVANVESIPETVAGSPPRRGPIATDGRRTTDDGLFVPERGIRDRSISFSFELR